jgi:hypothetical protein
MVRWVRTVTIAGTSKFGKAMEFAQISKGLTSRFPEAKKIEVFIDMFGNSGNVRWSIDYPDLATLEKVQRKILADADYWKLLTQYEDAFVQGQVEDIVMMEI